MTFEEYWATTGPWPDNFLGIAIKEVGRGAWEASAVNAAALTRAGAVRKKAEGESSASLGEIENLARNIERTAKYPHCDQDVLHAPGKCEYCDMYLAAQAKRMRDGINFTGESVLGREPCPSDARRGLAGAHVWGGNRPKK